jgi:flagellin
MAIRLQTNPAGLIARQNFSGNLFYLSDSVRKLSSGLRVNNTADDSVSVTLARQLDTQGLSLGQAVKNANDGISAMSVVDNSLAQAMDILGTIQTKAQMATREDLTVAARTSLQSDITKLLKEIDQLVDSSTFRGVPLLNGTYTNKAFQIGANFGETILASLPSIRQGQIGDIHTGEMTITSERGGQVNLRLENLGNGERLAVSSVSLAYANDPAQGMGGLAAAINAYAATTGISARAVVQSTSGGALTAGTTPDAFSINGVKIGAVPVVANDSNNRLVNAINAKTASHGVTASVGTDGRLTLSAGDGRAIAVSGSGGEVGFTDAEMTTFGFTRILQNGPPYNIALTDFAGGLAVPFSPTMEVAAPIATTIDSTLAAGSVLGNSSILAAGWTAGLEMNGVDLNGDIVTTSASTLDIGSVLASGSILAASSILGGTASLGTSVSTEDETWLRAGSKLASGSVIGRGSYLTNAIDTTSGTMAAGQTLTVGVTLTGDQTLSRDMLLASGSVLGAGSSLTALSRVGGEVVLNGPLTMSQEMTLSPGSSIRDEDGVTRLAAGSIIGGIARLGGSDLSVTEPMLIKAGSTLSASSQLALGSTIGGLAVLAGDQTLSQDLYMAAGSKIAGGSTIASGTTLTNALMTTDGLLLAGTTTTKEYQTSGANSLSLAMTLKRGSMLTGGSILAANSRNETAVLLGQESALSLNNITVLTKDDADTAIKIVEAAMADLEKTRQQASGISGQFAGFATVQGGARDIMESSRAKLMDLDFGDEAGNFTRMEMLIRTSSFALAQANAVPSNVFLIMQGGDRGGRANQFFIAALNRLLTSGRVS